MSNKENETSEPKLSSIKQPGETHQDPLGSADVLTSPKVPSGVARRDFLIRSAVVGAAAVMTGRTVLAHERVEQAVASIPHFAQKPAPPLSADLNVVKKGQGPVMTVLEEFYKVGPGPSSSHTIGPMRITYDFYQRATKLPADKLATATALKVNLFGSLSATGKGHGTERAALAGLIGNEPATVDPLFLDSLRDKPDQTFEVKLGSNTIKVSLKDIIYDATKGDFKHPNTMTCKLLAGDAVLLEQEYYSVGGGFIEWKGYTPPKKNAPKYPFRTMKELRAHADTNKLTIAQVMLANEMSIPGKTEEEVWAFVDKIINAMNATVKSGLAVSEDDVLPGPIKLHSKAATVYKRAMDEKYQSDRGIGVLSAYALAGSEENGRGHLVITAPTGGSAGVMPSLVYALGEGGRKLPLEKIRNGMLAAAAVGYLCKHHATLSAAEGGCQAEIGVASAMAAALVATAYDAESKVVENAAESALEHHLGMTCDPVAGFVQVPCIERCAFGAVKAWTAWAIASNEVASRHRVDLDATIMALAETARDMNSKYKETSEAGLALSVVLC
ncbi:MAG TPA: L-serine ammonia-lyase [Pyrinomonadaceae bacterium]|jgi:L-serine dehydratase|nr:L-serine ammonia-lyase [Pyrinomonadaceae bacterium]